MPFGAFRRSNSLELSRLVGQVLFCFRLAMAAHIARAMNRPMLSADALHNLYLSERPDREIRPLI
jgi:hypothetical protein